MTLLPRIADAGPAVAGLRRRLRRCGSHGGDKRARWLAAIRAGLAERLPAGIATHSTLQTLSFDAEGLLKRRDYDVAIAGNTTGAHIVEDDADLSGIKFPTKAPDLCPSAGRPLHTEPLAVSVDLSNIRLSQHERLEAELDGVRCRCADGGIHRRLRSDRQCHGRNDGINVSTSIFDWSRITGGGAYPYPLQCPHQDGAIDESRRLPPSSSDRPSGLARCVGPCADRKRSAKGKIGLAGRVPVDEGRRSSAMPSMTSAGIPIVPASLFGMVLGLAGLGGAWRAAHLAWGLPPFIGEAVMMTAALVWLVVSALYMLKWLAAREAALAEAVHPVQCCFIGLAGVATMLVAGGVLPYSYGTALGLYVAGALFTLGFAIWRTGGLWLGERDPSHTTPVLYLPTVAGSFVAGTVGGALGFADLGQFLFGMGFFGWLAIESVLLNRLLTAPSMASALRPTLGIQLAPPVVGAVSLIAVAPQAPLLLAHGMIGYGILQALILLRLLPWILREPFAPSYWAFTFGVTALATAPIRLLLLGDNGAVRYLAPVLFVFANAVVLVVAAGTLFHFWKLRRRPAAAGAPVQPAAASTRTVN